MNGLSARFGTPVPVSRVAGGAPAQAVYGWNGDPLTLADLPPPDRTFRWLPRRKATVLALVKGGVVSADEVRAKYGISAEELADWERQIEANGLRALCVTHPERRADIMPALVAARHEEWGPSEPIEVKVAGWTLRGRRLAGPSKCIRLGKYRATIVRLLMQYCGKTVSREAMMRRLYFGRRRADPKIIDVVLCKLRQRLHSEGVPFSIQTVWGVGYRLVPSATVQ